MISTVKAPPNHYAVLGIKPSASDEEIAQAFITKMFSPKPMTQVALIGAAYETLRNPTKRRAYDASLGFRSEPQGVLAKPVVAFSATARYVGGAPAISFERPAVEAARPVAPPVEPEVRHEPEAVFELPVAMRADPAKDGAFEWRRPAVIAGALVAAVGLIGAWAGSLAGNDVEAEQVTVPLPKAKAPAKVAVAAPEATPQIAEAPRTYVRPRRVERARSRPQPAQDRLADVSQSLRHSYYVSTAADGTSEIAAADAPQAPEPAPAMVAAAGAAAASMPLPNGTIARTLHKIGYSCGQVASTSAVEGQSGVFNVTCTSGQTYRASPVRGRYHFSRSVKN